MPLTSNEKREHGNDENLKGSVFYVFYLPSLKTSVATVDRGKKVSCPILTKLELRCSRLACRLPKSGTVPRSTVDSRRLVAERGTQ